MSLYQRLKPPKPWRIPVIILCGAIVGIGFYIMKISKVASYASDDPKVCVNCHVMSTEYASWRASSHREWATCNDCHVPHDNPISTYAFKAKDGLYHASVYTMRAEPEVIRIKEMGSDVVHQNCIRCHENQVMDAKLTAMVDNHVGHRSDRKCWECHREVPHGKQRSLSAIPIINDKEESKRPKVPEWLEKSIRK